MTVSTQPIETVLTTLDSLNAESFANDGDRNKALLAAYALVSRLETPWETVARIGMTQPALGASLKVAKDLQLFEKWHERGDNAESSKELATMVDCDPVLLARILRHLAANHVLEESAPGIFKPTPFSLSLLQPVFGEWINFLYDATLPCYLHLPTYLHQTSYANPISPTTGIFQSTKNYQGDLFQYYAAHPREGASFNHVMGAVMANQASWLDIIPPTHFLTDSDPTLPLIVDVGGNIEHDLEKFRAAYPHTAERLYLQDLEPVVKASKCPDPVVKMVHDFFEEQPVKDSRIYYLHGVLHDWGDEPARKILRMLRGALKAGYSRLLVHDHVVPEMEAHPHATSYDLTMMVMVAGKERTETEWRGLLGEAGYRVVRVWRSALAAQAILEAEVV
ncbi:hypothetical protein ASPCADRAFT_51459 [Aspergillus carbonarius ITEM 5010]|uniref:Uncharacterized protein n=1 Tax=Aspergillus carbonarius (strain ITEM 5010) TaxID=602072 RepID=A0A1R3RI97_ASPC5|nr:hypothetical protein ASPCADRAFT_51459 [Aspergillus carbonarius ITEM 5010]